MILNALGTVFNKDFLNPAFTVERNTAEWGTDVSRYTHDNNSRDRRIYHFDLKDLLSGRPFPRNGDCGFVMSGQTIGVEQDGVRIRSGLMTYAPLFPGSACLEASDKGTYFVLGSILLSDGKLNFTSRVDAKSQNK